MSGIITDIADLAEELCDPHRHRQQRYGWDKQRHKIRLPDHITTQAALLTQLHQAVVPLLSQAADDAGGMFAANSRPPLQLEALDRHHAITVAAAGWCSSQGLRAKLTARDNIRALVGHTNRLGDDHLHMLRADLRRWRNWAATMSGWESITRPRALCPVVECGAKNTLRVNLSTEAGMCAACGSSWDATTIGILAAHISAEKPAQAAPRIRSGVQGNGGWTTRYACSPGEGGR